MKIKQTSFRRRPESIIFLALILIVSNVAFAKKGGRGAPTVEVTEAGKILVLPDKVTAHLQKEFPNSRPLKESEFDPKMLQHFYSNLIGIHPAVAYGDFNGDKKKDYGILLVTGQSPWGPLVELIVLNQRKKKGKFDTYNLGEIYGHKLDYLRYYNRKLYKGKFRRGGWYINWDSKKKDYIIRKS